MTTEQWLASLFSAIDRMDAEAFCEFLAEDCVFRFGNGPSISGREAVGQAVGEFFGSIKEIRHELEAVIASDERIAFHGWVTYTRFDGTRLKIPFADHFTLRGREIMEYLIFADISQLYA